MLHAHEACSEFVHDMLDFVEEHMLVIEAPDRKRASCETVFGTLAKMQKRCASDIGYAFEPRPRPLPATFRAKHKPVPVQLNDAAMTRLSTFRQHLHGKQMRERCSGTATGRQRANKRQKQRPAGRHG